MHVSSTVGELVKCADVCKQIRMTSYFEDINFWFPWPAIVYEMYTIKISFDLRWFHGTSWNKESWSML